MTTTCSRCGAAGEAEPINGIPTQLPVGWSIVMNMITGSPVESITLCGRCTGEIRALLDTAPDPLYTRQPVTWADAGTLPIVATVPSPQISRLAPECGRHCGVNNGVVGHCGGCHIGAHVLGVQPDIYPRTPPVGPRSWDRP